MDGRGEEENLFPLDNIADQRQFDVGCAETVKGVAAINKFQALFERVPRSPCSFWHRQPKILRSKFVKRRFASCESREMPREIASWIKHTERRSKVPITRDQPNEIIVKGKATVA